MFFFSNYTPPAKEPVIDWIFANQDLIKQGAAAYNGKIVTLDSTLARYECVMSFILYTGRTSSPLLLVDTDEAKTTCIRLTALTLCFGWWALFGVWYTPEALWTNFSGGKKVSVRDALLSEQSPKVNQIRKTISDDAKANAKVLPMVPLFMLGIVVLTFVVVGIMIVAKKIMAGH